MSALRSFITWGAFLMVLFGAAEICASMFTHDKYTDLIGYDSLILGVVILSDSDRKRGAK